MVTENKETDEGVIRSGRMMKQGCARLEIHAGFYALYKEHMQFINA